MGGRASDSAGGGLKDGDSLAGLLERLLATLARGPLRLDLEPGLRAFGKQVWGPGACTLSPGVPRRVLEREAARWVRTDDMACEFVQVPRNAAQSACMLLPSEVGARWVDHILGGDGVVGQVRQLTQGEQGVLAYAVAHGLSLLAPGYQLSDVGRADARVLVERLRPSVVWPLALDTPKGMADLRIMLSEHAALSMALDGEIRVLLRDRLAQTELDELVPGDVLLSDSLPVTVTTEGLVGAVEVECLSSTSTILRAQLEGRSLRVVADAASSKDDGGTAMLSFVIAKQTMSFANLAAFVAGEPLELEAISAQRVSVLRAGRPFGEGTLVVQRGELGVRIDMLTAR